MNVLLLCYRDEPLRDFELRDRPLEVGSDAGCDIVVHDPGVRGRHALVMLRGGSVVADMLDGSPAVALPPNVPLRLGRNHSLVRIPDAPTRPRTITSVTEPLARETPIVPLSLVIGRRGGDAQRIRLECDPIVLGSAIDTDFVVRDKTVSAHHCRIEPSAGGYLVRDLRSRNGTFVDGVPVTLARIHAGSTLRVGRTDVRVVARGQPGVRAREGLVAASPSMCAVLDLAARFARLSWPVLVIGESGVGKEGVARAVHAAGPRAGGPFVAVNAGGMASSLIESELFGHEKGSFTGAAQLHRGYFEQADGGTLFLDEMGELPLEMQARLLRVLDTWEIRRVGSERPIKVDVRLVCATHRNLRKMVGDGRFRDDLYFRLARLIVEIPPLRERPEDVVELAQHFLSQTCEELGPRALGPAAVERLLAYPWPGNVRELRNVIQSAAAECAGGAIEASDVDAILARMATVALDTSALHLQEILRRHGGNLSAAARAAGLPRSTFRDRLSEAKDKA